MIAELTERNYRVYSSELALRTTWLETDKDSAENRERIEKLMEFLKAAPWKLTEDWEAVEKN